MAFVVADDVSRDRVGEWRDWWQKKEKVRAMRGLMCLWLHPPPPHAHAHTHHSPSLQSTHPTLAVSFCARGQVHSSGFLARSRDTPVDPCYCGFIKSFPPLSYCVWLHVFSVYVSVFVTLQVCVCVCVCARICHGGSSVVFTNTHTHTHEKKS